jgi:hypothetical protein
MTGHPRIRKRRLTPKPSYIWLYYSLRWWVSMDSVFNKRKRPIHAIEVSQHYAVSAAISLDANIYMPWNSCRRPPRLWAMAVCFCFTVSVALLMKFVMNFNAACTKGRRFLNCEVHIIVTWLTLDEVFVGNQIYWTLSELKIRPSHRITHSKDHLTTARIKSSQSSLSVAW